MYHPISSFRNCTIRCDTPWLAGLIWTDTGHQDAPDHDSKQWEGISLSMMHGHACSLHAPYSQYDVNVVRKNIDISLKCIIQMFL